MTVAELIAILERHARDASVIFHDEEIAIMQGDDTLDQINEKGANSDDAERHVVAWPPEKSWPPMPRSTPPMCSGQSPCRGGTAVTCFRSLYDRHGLAPDAPGAAGHGCRTRA